MALNISGYQITNTAGELTFGTSSTKIDTAGRLIIPNNPGFFGAKTGSNVQMRQYPWVINSTSLNINTCYNTTTGIFTCPVAGLYYTSWGGICNGGDNNAVATAARTGYVGVAKNGILQVFTHWNTNDYWDTQNLETILYCAAGDTIAWAVNIAPSPDSTSGYGAYGDNHNMSTIWLIG